MHNFAAQMERVKNIVVMASGSGSNAEAIMEYFQHSENVRVSLVVSNKQDAGVLQRGEKFNVPTLVINRETLYESETFLDVLEEVNPDLVILAGFLWKIPENLVHRYSGKIVNIHPSLLPKFGGKGMYGMHVHRAVVAAGESMSGITIHLIDEHYDRGEIVFQASVALEGNETPEEVQQKVLKLEHKHFPIVIDELLKRDSSHGN